MDKEYKMVDNRLTSKKSLESDDFLKDAKGYSVQADEVTHYASDVEGLTISEYLHRRHQKIKHICLM